jgi:hypothetical protein
MKDHADGGKRAFAIEPDYIAIDVFGNTDRFYVFPKSLEQILVQCADSLKENPHAFDHMTIAAQQYIDTRNASNPIEMLKKVIDE